MGCVRDCPRCILGDFGKLGMLRQIAGSGLKVGV